MLEEPATPDLVELTRRAHEYASDRNWGAVLGMYGPDTVWDITPMGLGVYQGPAAIRRFFEDWTGAYEEYQLEAEQIVDLGHGVVFVVAHQSGRPVGGDGYLRFRYATVLLWAPD